jgi:hypothetical protein
MGLSIFNARAAKLIGPTHSVSLTSAAFVNDLHSNVRLVCRCSSASELVQRMPAMCLFHPGLVAESNAAT